VKKAKQQAEKQAARQGAASSAGTAEKGGRGKVDLAALGEGLPAGWQVSDDSLCLGIRSFVWGDDRHSNLFGR
jgi:hypothetical protein